jgi:hypothetical protein
LLLFCMQLRTCCCGTMCPSLQQSWALQRCCTSCWSGVASPC